MINLYEFLGIAPTNDLTSIQNAISQAEAAGKDAKLIQACKNYLLKPDWKAKHDVHFGIKDLGEVIQPKKVSKIREGISNLSTPIDRMQVRKYVQLRQQHVQKLIDADMNPYQFNLDEADIIKHHIQTWPEDEQIKFHQLFTEEVNAITHNLEIEADKVLQKAANFNMWATVFSLIVFALIMYAILK